MIHMPLDDFCAFHPRQFSEVCKAFGEQREADVQMNYEVAHWHAGIVVSPHVRRKPKLELPWDKPKARRASAPQVSKEEAAERFRRLMEKEKASKE